MPPSDLSPDASPPSAPEAAVKPVLEVVGLEKAYGALKAVQGLTFQVAPGEVLGLVGLKDEGLLFAYGRPAARGERRFSLMPETMPARGEVIAALSDSQGERLKLVRRDGAR